MAIKDVNPPRKRRHEDESMETLYHDPLLFEVECEFDSEDSEEEGMTEEDFHELELILSESAIAALREMFANGDLKILR